MLGRDALRQYREQQARLVPEPECQPSVLDQIPPDAPMPDAVLSVWNGEVWVTWDRWLATAPIICEETPEARPAALENATCVAGECGSARIWLVKDGERWLMHVGSRRPKGRRRDFATPYLEHAIAAAEHWYGAAEGGWREEKNIHGSSKAQDLYPQAEDEGDESTRGNDELALDGR